MEVREFRAGAVVVERDGPVACVSLARHAKQCSPAIVNIIGNDHFSALYQEIMTRQQGVFDYGFCGNDVVEGFAKTFA